MNCLNPGISEINYQVGVVVHKIKSENTVKPYELHGFVWRHVNIPVLGTIYCDNTLSKIKFFKKWRKT